MPSIQSLRDNYNQNCLDAAMGDQDQDREGVEGGGILVLYAWDGNVVCISLRSDLKSTLGPFGPLGVRPECKQEFTSSTSFDV